jgi:hypothetical protein
MAPLALLKVAHEYLLHCITGCSGDTSETDSTPTIQMSQMQDRRFRTNTDRKTLPRVSRRAPRSAERHSAVGFQVANTICVGRSPGSLIDLARECHGAVSPV